MEEPIVDLSILKTEDLLTAKQYNYWIEAIAWLLDGKETAFSKAIFFQNLKLFLNEKHPKVVQQFLELLLERLNDSDFFKQIEEFLEAFMSGPMTVQKPEMKTIID
jgi:hypothetical protein